jgi:hypothetical protein
MLRLTKIKEGRREKNGKISPAEDDKDKGRKE